MIERERRHKGIFWGDGNHLYFNLGYWLLGYTLQTFVKIHCSEHNAHHFMQIYLNYNLNACTNMPLTRLLSLSSNFFLLLSTL